MTLVCITAELPGRSCTIRGEHLSGCLGGTCTGCLPRKAEHGCLCRNCHEKWVAALGVTVELVTFLLSGGSAPVDVNRSRGKPGPRLPIPSGRIAADQIVTNLCDVIVAHAKAARVPEPVWPRAVSIFDGFLPSASLDESVSALSYLVWCVESVEGITARVEPAEMAVGFTREVQRQLARFPLAESRSKVPYLRCPSCRDFKIMDVPPLYFMDDRLLKCDQCGHVYDPLMKEFDLRVYRSEVEAAIAAREAA
jgi:hypothetical protein